MKAFVTLLSHLTRIILIVQIIFLLLTSLKPYDSMIQSRMSLFALLEFPVAFRLKPVAQPNIRFSLQKCWTGYSPAIISENVCGVLKLWITSMDEEDRWYWHIGHSNRKGVTGFFPAVSIWTKESALIKKICGSANSSFERFFHLFNLQYPMLFSAHFSAVCWLIAWCFSTSFQHMMIYIISLNWGQRWLQADGPCIYCTGFIYCFSRTLQWASLC